jgi:hypothetical protein
MKSFPNHPGYKQATKINGFATKVQSPDLLPVVIISAMSLFIFRCLYM